MYIQQSIDEYRSIDFLNTNMVKWQGLLPLAKPILAKWNKLSAAEKSIVVAFGGKALLTAEHFCTLALATEQLIALAISLVKLQIMQKESSLRNLSV